MKQYTYDYYKKSADYILSKLPKKPDVALIIGSALQSLTDEIKNKVVVKYKDVPNFLLSTVEDHAGEFVCGDLGGKYIVAMSGRFHYYEGYDFEQLASPIRVLKLLGIGKTILTNAVGSVNATYKVGDIMIINDHINFRGASPMRGQNINELGNRFFDMSNVYNKNLISLAHDSAVKLGQHYRVHEGIYFYMVGPHFETPAEIRAIRILGGDVVGMSTVTEVITAAHCGMDILGLSLITNKGAGLVDTIDGDEVSKVGEESSERFKALLRKIVTEMEI